MCMDWGEASCTHEQQLGIAKNSLTNHKLVSMHLKVTVLGDSVCIHS